MGTPNTSGSLSDPGLADCSQAIFHDIQLADAKAAFSLTISALGVAGAASFFGAVPDPVNRFRVLTNPFVLSFLSVGLLALIGAIIAAVVTVLPRRYVRSVDPVVPDKTISESRVNRCWRDLWQSFCCNFPIGSATVDHASVNFEAMCSALRAGRQIEWTEHWINEVGRRAKVRRLKYWWVGPSILLATIGVTFTLGAVCASVVVMGYTLTMPVTRIISGGQSGADRAALDAAKELGLKRGGWVPKGRLAEDGQIPPSYDELVETTTSDYATRTSLNIRDADATLIISHGGLTGGSRLTLDEACRLGRPFLHIDLSKMTREESVRLTRKWIEATRCERLNVAGPRSSEDPGIYSGTYELLIRVLKK